MRRAWLLAAGAAAAGVTALRPFRVEVAGRSMEPTLRPGDWLMATRAGSIRRGDIVVLRHPRGHVDVVKRVAGVPGDRLADGTLGPDQFLVVGDNAAASTDGLTWGPVRREAIEGVVRFRYWPSPGPVR
jgi:signal peptidase I